ncbi:MAG: fibronectin type III domain-containing protein [Cytophagaceae bacterium]
MARITVLAISWILIFCLNIQAQDTDNKATNSVEVVAKSFKDSIVLRWAPTTPMAWRTGLREGYVVERYLLLKDGKPDKKVKPERMVLTGEPIKPLALQQWEKLGKQDNNALVAAQAIYGKSFAVSNSKDELMNMVSISKEAEMRFSFALFAADQSLMVAQASGLLYTDKLVKSGEKYLYRIYINNSSMKIDTGSVFIGTDDMIKLPKPLELQAEFSDRTVMLSWNKAYYDHLFSGYIVERSEDGGISYKNTKLLPFVNTTVKENISPGRMYIIDSLPENNKLYHYRIRGKTIFQEFGPASEPVQGSGIPKSIGLSPNISKTEYQKDGTIKINWKYPKELEKEIKEFEILRANKADGEYLGLGKTNAAQRIFIDEKPGRANYYIIKARESNGSYSSSFPALGQIIDSIPPGIPQGLSGKAEMSGLVRLQWKKGKEDDLHGYRIYRANGPDEEFSQITIYPVTDTMYTDTINIHTLTKNVYYKVMALDMNYNFSGLTKALVIKRPDVVPPVSPRIDNYLSSDSCIMISWIPSSSNDVVKHKILRRHEGKNEWKAIAEFNKMDVKSYCDSEVEIKKAYQYCVIAVDDSGLESEKKQIINVQLIDYGFRPDIKSVNIVADRSGKEVVIQWLYNDNQPEKFLIYRAEKGNPVRLYKSVAGVERVFKDKNVKMNTDYVYQLKAVYSDGGASRLTKEVVVSY